MKRPGARWLLAGWMVWAVDLPAAQPTNESFTAGASGWAGTTGSTPFGETGVWSFTGGAARVLFFNPGFPVPDSATLSNTPTASGGAFTGNYDQAGINLIGFSVLAPQIVPDGFVILEGGQHIALSTGIHGGHDRGVVSVHRLAGGYGAASMDDAAGFHR